MMQVYKEVETAFRQQPAQAEDVRCVGLGFRLGGGAGLRFRV